MTAALATFLTMESSRVQMERIERQYTIITRCDLGGQLHKVVASDLGISMRTFYRERREGFERLRRALETIPVSNRPHRRRPTMPCAASNGHGSQVALGRIREAIVRLEEIAVSAPPALLAVACARLAAARFLAYGEASAAEALTRARRALAMLGPGAASIVAEAEIRVVEALQLERDRLLRRSLAPARAHRRRPHEQCAARPRHGAPGACSPASKRICARRRGAGAGDRRRRPARPGQRPAERSIRRWDWPSSSVPSITGSNVADCRHDALALQAAAVSRGEVLFAAGALRIAAQASLALVRSRGGLAHCAARRLRSLAKRTPGASHRAMLLELAGTFAELGDGETALGLVEAASNEPMPRGILAGIRPRARSGRSGRPRPTP